MTHLTPVECVDAAEGTLEAGRLGHLDRCETCRREVDRLARLARAAAEGPVPEPSPLFWEHFSARVGAAVRAEGVPAPPGWSAWLRRPALVPLAALAALIVAVVAPLAPTVPAPAPPAVTASDDPPFAAPATERMASDLEWRALAEIVGPLDWETAEAAGLAVMPGETERAVADLDEGERRELSRLIAGELSRAKS
jgi:hypothetical protein